MPAFLMFPTGMLTAIIVFAASPEPWSVFLNYGVIGAILILAAFGWISFKPHVDSLNKRIDAQAEIIREFQMAGRSVVQAQGRVTDVLEQLPANDVSVKELHELVSRLEELAGPDGGSKARKR